MPNIGSYGFAINPITVNSRNNKPLPDRICATPTLSVQSVNKSFTTKTGTVEVLKNVNINVYKSDFTIITGPSGSGKTTFLHLAALLDVPSSGKIIINGKDTSFLTEYDLAKTRISTVGIVFQRFCLLNDRTVLDNVLLTFRYTPIPVKEQIERAQNAMQNTGVDHLADRQASVLSAGEMQRTAIARAIANAPSIIIADEPTGNLDFVSAKKVMDCFQELHSKGVAIIMATHNTALLSYGNKQYVCQERSIKDMS